MVSGTRRVAAALAALVVLGAGAEAASAHSFDLEGHRGTRGLRPENTLAAFGKALRDRRHDARARHRCDQGRGGGRLPRAADLVAGVPGPVRRQAHPRADLRADPEARLRHAPSRPTPRPIRSSARRRPSPARTCRAWPRSSSSSTATAPTSVQFDIETKRDPTLPKETVGPTTFAKKVIAVISRYHMTKRSVLQSFDWSTLQAARKIKPRLRRAALAQATTIFPGTPWTGGIDDQAQPLRRRPRARGGRQAPRPGPVGQLPRHHRQRSSGPRTTHGLTIIPWTVDDPGRHGGGHRPRPRRAHHRLPRQGPRRDGRQGPRPARADRVAVRHRGPPRRARLPAREHAQRLRATGSTTGSTRWRWTSA